MNGAILWHHGGHVVIATGLKVPSANPKTGPMVQAFLLRDDVPPADAVASGLDETVCNACSFRPVAARALGKGATRCYVTSAFSLQSIFRAFQRGTYPVVSPRKYSQLLRGKRIRLGAYGNFSNVPIDIVGKLAWASDAWTMFDHNWDAPHAQPFRHLSMASVASPWDKLRANALGWRTYRTKKRYEPVLPDEVVCPASREAGARTTCYQCRLCCGTHRRAKNVVIDDHGPSSRTHLELVQLGRRTARPEGPCT
jgi:hypothetical protein